MYVAGIDVGSISTEAVIMNERLEIVAFSTTYTGANVARAGTNALASALEQAGLKAEDIAFHVSTGYARKRVELAEENVTEISCHCRGANFLFPGTRTVIDIGGQDSKVIWGNEKGRVLKFVMNDKCAAGTGRFLEVMARALEVDLEAMGPLSLQNKQVLPVSSMCTVFAESEVINLLAAGHEREDILAGIHHAIAKRVTALMGRNGRVEEVTMTGGVAKNSGEVHALEDIIGVKVNVPEEPQIVGAIGAAIIALEKGREASRDPEMAEELAGEPAGTVPGAARS